MKNVEITIGIEIMLPIVFDVSLEKPA